jgi:hypothetical protein
VGTSLIRCTTNDQRRGTACLAAPLLIKSPVHHDCTALLPRDGNGDELLHMIGLSAHCLAIHNRLPVRQTRQRSFLFKVI